MGDVYRKGGLLRLSELWGGRGVREVVFVCFCVYIEGYYIY